jgi:thioredoxin-related protein
MERSASDGYAVLAYVNAPWCGVCKRMEREVFPQNLSLLSRLGLAEINFDDVETEIRVGEQSRSPFDWARALGIDRTPGFALIHPDGSLLATATGYMDALSFGLFLAYGATGAYRHATFEEYARTTIH